jgi:putative ABC transport system substrate-binding protein
MTPFSILGFGLSIEKSSDKRVLFLALALMFSVLWTSAEAQHPKKLARIGYFSSQSGPGPTLMTFKEGLRELGWIEGKQIEFEYRYYGAQRDKVSEFATELVRRKVDVIVGGPGRGPAVAAKRATTTIPIVMVAVVDPVSNGLVASLARPGGNVTGLTFEATHEQAGKNLEILKEAIPHVSRVAILRNPNQSNHIPYSKEAERAATILGVTTRFAEMRASKDTDLQAALSAAVKAQAGALLVAPYPFFADRKQQIINFAAEHKLPAIYFSSAFVNDGGLMSYGPSGQDIWRRAATYVDKILKGTKPADLPVEQPKKFELVINLKTAKQIGLTIPPNVLARADRVIR